MHRKLVSELINPPPFTARVKTGGGEYRIRTPYHPTPINKAKRARLRELSRQRYYRSVRNAYTRPDRAVELRDEEPEATNEEIAVPQKPTQSKPKLRRVGKAPSS